MQIATGWLSPWRCMLQVTLMLTDDPTEEADALEPEVRPRFQHEWEAQQHGTAAEAAAPKRARGKQGRSGKWQVCTSPVPCSPVGPQTEPCHVWCTLSHPSKRSCCCLT